MRFLTSMCVALAAIVATASAASAQSLIVIALCSHDDPAGPTFTGLQVSDAVRTTCMDLTPDTGDFCLGIAELSAAAGTGMACSAAIRDLHLFGVEKTFVAAATPHPSEVRPAVAQGKAAGNQRHGHVFQHNQTDLQFLMERADGSVDLIGCEVFAADGPGATYVQTSDLMDDVAVDLSCANALQQSLDTGAALSAAGSTASVPAPHPGVRLQQGRVILDSDHNEAKPAEFVIVRVGQWTMTPN